MAAFPEAEMRNDVVFFNGSAFPVTILIDKYGNGEYMADSLGWAGDLG